MRGDFWYLIGVWEKFLIILGVVFYLLWFPHGIHGDATVRYIALQELLETGHPSRLIYSYVHPLLSAPLLLLGHLFKNGFWWLSRFNTFVFLATVFYSASWVKRQWGSETARTFILLMFCATMFPRHITDYYSEVFSACMILVALIAWQSGRSAPVILAIALSVWNTPATMLAGALLLAYIAYRKRRLRFLLAVAILPIGNLLENFWKFGEVYPREYLNVEGLHNYLPYSGGPGFTYPFFFGLLSVLFSFGKGLVFFMPGLIALFCSDLWRVERKEKDILVASILYLAGLVLVFSRWWAWFGGWYWGPRFFLFASILNVFILLFLLRPPSSSMRPPSWNLSRAWRIFLVAALALSFWVGCIGVTYGQDFLDICSGPDPKLEFICYYVPEYSALWRVFVAQPMPFGWKWGYLAYFFLVALTLLGSPCKTLFAEIKAECGAALGRAKVWTGWKF